MPCFLYISRTYEIVEIQSFLRTEMFTRIPGYRGPILLGSLHAVKELLTTLLDPLANWVRPYGLVD